MIRSELLQALARENPGMRAEEIEKVVTTFFDEIAQRLDEVDLVWAPVQTPAQVAADPQVAAAGALIDVEDGQGGVYRSPAAPAPCQTPARPAQAARAG